MRYINRRFTYLLTYLLTYIPALITSRLAGVSLWAVITLQTNANLSLNLCFQQAKMVVHYQFKKRGTEVLGAYTESNQIRSNLFTMKEYKTIVISKTVKGGRNSKAASCSNICPIEQMQDTPA